jgi:chemotaxis receptor (MCP) glutamine deamidase CheD
MFASVGNALDVGARNDRAVRDALRGEGIRVHNAETGGGVGRTIRVHVDGVVTVKEAGGREVELLGAAT